MSERIFKRKIYREILDWKNCCFVLKLMKNLSSLAIVATILSGCATSSTDDSTDDNQESIRTLQRTIDSLTTISLSQSQTIQNLRDSVELLKFPASDRLTRAKALISEGNFSQAEIELTKLATLFPASKEAMEVSTLSSEIQSEKEKIRLEKERIEALGFKALPQKSTLTISYNTITLSAFSTATQFVFDAYDNSWHYQTADRDNKYVTMAMTVKSTSKTPMIPQFAVYSINGKTMNLVTTFTTEYARWSDFGSYLGNYSDTRNDFAKVSSVSFKLGAEVSQTVLSGPYAIVVYNMNVLSENYDRFHNPPQYWTGSAPYPPTLTIDSFKSDFTLIKTFNLN